MIGGPAIGQHLIETRIVSVQAQQNFAQVGPGLDPMTLCSGEDGEQNGGSRPACSLPRNSQFFRPMAWCRSVRSLTLLSIVSRPSSV